MKRLASDVLALHMLTSGRAGSTSFDLPTPSWWGALHAPPPGTSLTSSWVETDVFHEN